MTDTSDLFEPRPGPSGTRFTEIRHFSVIDSTNRYLLDEAKHGGDDGLVAVADDQTRGRGRHGRMWDSKPGSSLLLSVLLRPRDANAAQRATQAMGLAVLDACSVVAGVDGQLKWPNDVLVGKRKLAGVLAEAVTAGDDIEAVVVGVGLNLNWSGVLPEVLKETATSLDAEAGHAIDRDALLDALLHALHERLSRPTWLLQAYRQRCATIGAPVRVDLADGVITGVAMDVADNGALLLRTDDGDDRLLTVGDVVHLRAT